MRRTSTSSATQHVAAGLTVNVWASPKRFAAAIRYLASPKAWFVYGCRMVIDGGLLA